MSDQAHRAAANLTAVRRDKPLVHNITNFVVMNATANALLACGASPVMAHAEEEVEDMVGIASALVLNIGTLSPAWVSAMATAAACAVAFASLTSSSRSASRFFLSPLRPPSSAPPPHT